MFSTSDHTLEEGRSGSSTVGWVRGMEPIAGNIAEVKNGTGKKRKKQQRNLKEIMSTIG